MAFLDPQIVPFVSTFLLVFAVFFFLLNKSKITEKNISIVISLAIALFASSYQPLVLGLQGVLPAAIVLILVVFTLFLLKDFGDRIGTQDMTPTAFALAITLILLAILWDRIVPLMQGFVDTNNILWLVGLIIIALLFYVIYKQGGATPE